ncbi:MAG: DUF1326 domain-containing protein [Acidobacteria bacterium]|nr:DUF1326 domain-containing protein [Acidobacteriota bacterium]
MTDQTEGAINAMKKFALAAVAAALTLTASLSAEIRGKYLETRNAEIYASHCFANSEAGIKGDLAVMAWSIESGEAAGVDLQGLSVVAVVKASSTIGNPFLSPLPTKTMLIFDEKATPEQRVALEAFARRSAGELISEVVKTEIAPISLDAHGNLHAKQATLVAGDLVKVSTRAIEASDSLCHMDNIYYQPMVELEHAMAAHALQQSVKYDSVGVNMNEYRRSSVYLGAFAAHDKAVSDD